MIYDKNDADFEDKVKQVSCEEKSSSSKYGTVKLAYQARMTTFLSCDSVLTIIFYIIILVFLFSQLIEVSGKTQDECMVALHDCNEDVNRAINFLLESTSDTV